MIKNRRNTMPTYEVLMVKERSGYIRIEADSARDAYLKADKMSESEIIDSFVDNEEVDEQYYGVSADEVVFVDGCWSTI